MKHLTYALFLSGMWLSLQSIIILLGMSKLSMFLAILFPLGWFCLSALSADLANEKYKLFVEILLRDLHLLSSSVEENAEKAKAIEVALKKKRKTK